MKAGRELDALVAEKVMGWRWVQVPKDCDGLNEGRCLAPVGLDEKNHQWTPKGKISEYSGPRYSTDIAAAWEVVEKLCLSVCASAPGLGGKPASYWVGFADMSGRFLVADLNNPSVVCEETAPLAICLAALKAVGVDLLTFQGAPIVPDPET